METNSYKMLPFPETHPDKYGYYLVQDKDDRVFSAFFDDDIHLFGYIQHENGITLVHYYDDIIGWYNMPELIENEEKGV